MIQQYTQRNSGHFRSPSFPKPQKTVSGRHLIGQATPRPQFCQINPVWPTFSAGGGYLMSRVLKLKHHHPTTTSHHTIHAGTSLHLVHIHACIQKIRTSCDYHTPPPCFPVAQQTSCFCYLLHAARLGAHTHTSRARGDSFVEVEVFAVSLLNTTDAQHSTPQTHNIVPWFGSSHTHYNMTRRLDRYYDCIAASYDMLFYV